VIGAAIVGFSATVTKLVSLVRTAAAAVEKQLQPLLTARATIDNALAQAELDKAALVAEAASGNAQNRPVGNT
jgi:hypothetical protein